MCIDYVTGIGNGARDAYPRIVARSASKGSGAHSMACNISFKSQNRAETYGL